MVKKMDEDQRVHAFKVGSDGKVAGVRVETLRAEESWAVFSSTKLNKGDTVFRAVGVKFRNEIEAGGAVHISVNVLDIDGGPIEVGVAFAYPQYKRPNWDGLTHATKKKDDKLEFIQGAGSFKPDPNDEMALGPYAIFVDKVGGKPVASDYLLGFGLPGNRHVSFTVTFQECRAYEDDVEGLGPPGETPSTGESGPTPEAPAEEQLRRTAWDALKIGLQSGSSLQQYARQHGLGAPMTEEMDVDGVRVQGFVLGIVYGPAGGPPDRVAHIAW